MDGTALSEARGLVMEVFVPTGSARAFRMMPILVRLADRRDAADDGPGLHLRPRVSGMTNRVLLINQGLSVEGYRVRLWPIVLLLAAIVLGIAVAIGNEPY